MGESTVEPSRLSRSGLDERVLDAGTTQRFALLLVLFVAESMATAYDFVSRLAKVAGGGAVPTWVSYVALAVLVYAAVWLYELLPRWKGRRSRVIPVADIEDGGRLREELDRLVKLATSGPLRRPRHAPVPRSRTLHSTPTMPGRSIRYCRTLASNCGSSTSRTWALPQPT